MGSISPYLAALAPASFSSGAASAAVSGPETVGKSQLSSWCFGPTDHAKVDRANASEGPSVEVDESPALVGTIHLERTIGIIHLEATIGPR